MVGRPLHGMVDFSRCRLLRRLLGVLVHLSFGFKEYGAIFRAVVSTTTMEHAIWGSECVWASTATTAAIWCAASLTVMGGP